MDQSRHTLDEFNSVSTWLSTTFLLRRSTAIMRLTLPPLPASSANWNYASAQTGKSPSRKKRTRTAENVTLTLIKLEKYLLDVGVQVSIIFFSYSSIGRFTHPFPSWLLAASWHRTLGQNQRPPSLFHGFQSENEKKKKKEWTQKTHDDVQSCDFSGTRTFTLKCWTEFVQLFTVAVVRQ